MNNRTIEIMRKKAPTIGDKKWITTQKLSVNLQGGLKSAISKSHPPMPINT